MQRLLNSRPKPENFAPDKKPYVLNNVQLKDIANFTEFVNKHQSVLMEYGAIKFAMPVEWKMPQLNPDMKLNNVK